MELLMDIIMELVPDVVSDFFFEKCQRFIRQWVENPVLRKIFYGLTALVLATMGVLLGFCLICLIGALFQ